IDKGSDTITVDHMLAIEEPKQVSARRVVVNRVRSFVSKPRSGVFGDNRSLLNKSCRVDTVGVNLRPANHQCHATSRLALDRMRTTSTKRMDRETGASASQAGCRRFDRTISRAILNLRRTDVVELR